MSADLADSASGYREIFEGGRLDVLLIWKFMSKQGLIPWTEIIVGGESLIWVAKQIFARSL